MNKGIIPILLLVTILLFGCQRPTTTSYNEDGDRIAAPSIPKNIILLVGDGMGLAQVSTVYYFQDRKPSFSRFHTIGLHQNTPVGNQITDSASGATAFSAGVKTYNGAIGVDEDTLPVATILEWAAEQGKRTGVIATSSITHATPASFYAHVDSRNKAEDIALQLVDAPVDFFAGGGLKYFNKRKDELDLISALQTQGFTIDTTELPQLVAQQGRYGYLLAEDGMPKMSDGRGPFLPRSTKLALDFLSADDNGFFLMVEGSQIDWGGHANDGKYIIDEMKDFDRVIGDVLDFAERDGETLVIVTADHETGGLSLSGAMIFGRADYDHIETTFSTGGHSASLIPVFAYGPGEDIFGGIYQNNDIYHKMMEAWRAEL